MLVFKSIFDQIINVVGFLLLVCIKIIYYNISTLRP